MNLRIVAILTVLLFSVPSITSAVTEHWGLKKGDPMLKSAGPIAFGPDGILFVGDTKAATLVAIGTGESSGDPSKATHEIDDLEAKVAAAIGSVGAKDVQIVDLAVNPRSGSVYLSVSAKGSPSIVKVRDGKVTIVSMSGVPTSRLALPDAPEDKVTKRGRREVNLRNDSVTDLVYMDGTLLVSGASNQQGPASIREFGFPFHKADRGVNPVIYHAAHGREEDNAVPRVLVPFTVDGEPSLLAGFICTPLVQFPINAIEPGKQVRGKTIAELGNRNKPLDMIVYEKDGATWLLIANSARGVMKVSTRNIERQSAITEKVERGGTAGLSYDTIADLKGVVQLDRLDETRAVIAIQSDAGTKLRTISLP